MFIDCEVIPRRDASLEERETLLEAIKRWSEREVEPSFRRALSEEGLARGQTVSFCVQGHPERDRSRLIESLRETIPPELVEDILVDDLSWSIDPE